jgi:glycosyltransferase involved in cell wall biosynthesis
MVLPARADLDPSRFDGVTFYPYKYAPTKELEVFGYAESLRADVALRRSAYLMTPMAAASGAAKMLALGRRGRFDLIHAHWVVPNGVMALPVRWLTGLPLVVSLHGSDVFLSEKNAAIRRGAQHVFRRAAAVTACSDDLAGRSEKLGAKNPVTVPYGVSTDLFEPARGDTSALRQKLGLSSDAPVILAVGRLVHKKGFEYLVDAAPKICAEFPETVIVFAGQGDLKEALEERSKSHGISENVRLVGNVDRDELPAYYALASVVAVPSVRDDAGNVDGLPNVLLEGMASGSPIVASDVAGIPQAVRDGREGLLVGERDADSIARAVLELLRSPERRERLGSAARKRAKESFDWSRVGERFEAIFRSVTGARGTPS